MNEQALNRYEPDYAVPPGEVLQDYLDSYGMTQAELATRLGLSKKTVNEVIKGKAPIVSVTALRLERVFGRPAHFWTNIEQRYQEDRARLSEKERLREHLDWLKRVPVKQMAKLGFIRLFRDRGEQLNEVLCFFGVTSPEQWRNVWQQHQVAFRQSQRFEPCAESVSAWLRRGEILAQNTDCAAFDKQRFQKVLQQIRELTREPALQFQARLSELCAGAGVAVVFVPDLPNTGVSGATRWLGSKAVIQLSLRYKSNDHFWFTFFHEAGHILKHGRKETFLEGQAMAEEMEVEKEEQADQFARDFLIPAKAWREFIAQSGMSLVEISRFADEINIAPGIVVGRLQFEGLLPMDRGNWLKVFYRWANE